MAFRTISEVSEELGIAQHVLRYWETRFPQLRPVQRAGKRRYYRPEDVALVRRIHELLNGQGYTVKGVQKLLAARAAAPETLLVAPPPPPLATPATGADLLGGLQAVRDRLQQALDRDTVLGQR